MTAADRRLAGLLRAHPTGLTKREIVRLAGIPYEAIDNALYRLERRGVLLCEDARRVSIYQYQEPDTQ